MRYTTIIDITEIPAVWRNDHIAKLYTYMTLKCGYHDEDRDRLAAGYRTLAAAAGITEDACRHALTILQREGLLRRDGNAWVVTKFVLEKKPTARTQKSVAAPSAAESSIGNLMREMEEQRERRMRAIREGIHAATIEELEAMKARLDSGKNVMLNGEKIMPTRQNKEDLEKLITKRKKAQ